MTSPGDKRGRSTSSRLQGAPFLEQVARWHDRSPGGEPPRDVRAELALRHAEAVALWTAGRAPEAMAALGDIAVQSARDLGTDDVDTLVAQGNLAVVLAALGYFGEALSLLTTNVGVRERVLGELHPATLTARDALATVHRLGGSVEVAVDLSARVVAERAQVLGTTHRDTLVSVLGNALALLESGDHDRAIDQMLALRQQAAFALGTDDILCAAIDDLVAHASAEVVPSEHLEL